MDGYGTTSNWWPRPHYQHFSTRSHQKSSSASNEALTESGKKLNEPTNWIQKFSIFLIVIVILASIAIAIAVPILIGNGPKPDDVDVFFDIKIEQDYNPYNDSNSLAYKAYVNNLCRLLIPVLNGPGQIGANYVTDSCQVVNLKRGSIIARVTSSFHIVDTRQTSINDIENNIFSTFVQRVDNGSFGLPVDKTAFTISGRSRSRTGKDPCDPSLTTCDQICTSDGTNVQCSCFKGYQLNGYKCEGVDICGLGLDKCDHKTTYCLNGGYQTFTCPCLVGYKPDPSLVTTSSPLGQLPPTPTSCIDINECVEMPWVCNNNTSTCNNTIGGYVCNCLAGYMPSPEPFMANICIDIDECAYPYKDNHCDYTTTTCVNTPGNYTCACRPGFDTYANYYCSNINECTTLMPCNLNTSLCQDTFGAFRCNCIQPNFTQSIDGSCIDVDECALQRDTCNVYNQTCLNNFGGFTCPCKVGFNVTSSGDCVDIDECMAMTSPCPNMNCSNTVGSYYCYCPAGFNLTTLNSANACQDIDECAIRPSVCYLSDSYCNNTVGNFSCPCKFTVDLGTQTNPVDSCTIGESGFFIKSTMAATAGATTVTYNTAVNNYGLLSGSPPFASIQTRSALSGVYWVHQTLASAMSTSLTPSWGTNTFVVGLSRATYDMTSAGALLNSSTTNAISTAIKQGTPTGDGTYDTSLIAFSTAAIAGIASAMGVTNFFPQNFSISVPPLSSGSGLVPIFVSLTTASASGSSHVVQVLYNSQVILQNRFDRNDTSSDTITSAAIVSVPAGMLTLTARLVSGNTSCAATNSSCSLSFFSYSPNDARFTSVYWSIYRSSPLLATTEATVGFNIVSVVGQTGLWDGQNNAVVAPVTGAYYININAATQPNKDLDVRIFVNGLDVSIGLYSYQSSGVVSKSRAAIVMLNKGDRVTVVAAPGTGLYGDTNWPSSSFTGFLLYARQ